MASRSVKKRQDGVWRARYRDEAGKEHARHFKRKVDAQRWLDSVTASVVRGDYVDPKTARLTVGEWCDLWLVGYATRRPSTVRQAKVHVNVIRDGLGDKRLSDVKPSHVKAWTVQLQGKYAPSTTYAIYRRLAQIMSDAVHDGIIPKSPCSRRTSPGQAKQRPYVATTHQVWALHDAMPEHLRAAVLLGAFVGLRVSEAVALRVSDVDFMRGIVRPEVQYPDEPLKTETSRTPIPIPHELALALSANVERYGGPTIVTNQLGRPVGPAAVEHAVRAVRGTVEGLPEGFRFHDLRHYLASLLISQGLDVKVVQTRMRHANATTTLNVYGHMFPDTDESARAAVAVAFASRADSLRTEAGS
ncbi:tyrosine-type recombinase/integrase [Arsenicicoccus cauae]|uniref:tyrosine-type recombinase/integrase n=1 Tax=Arsenicicoccus cauae TaxID=2663847 RepID=UPI00289EDEA2|nr:tyrosine-type recombinase/integrase [Arsenicicoccus cauae]